VSHEGERSSAGTRWLPRVARRALELERLVVKEGDVLWVADAAGDVRPPAPPDDSAHEAAASLSVADCGLYHAGACFLSCCVLAIEGNALPGPSAAESQGYEATLAFPELVGRRADLSVLRTFVADGAAVHQWITVETQAPQPVPVTLTLTFGADFRGAPASLRAPGAQPGGARPRPTLSGRKLRFAGTGPDERLAGTTIAFDRLPRVVQWLEAEEQLDGVPLVNVTFQLRPALAEPATLAFAVVPALPAPSIRADANAAATALPSTTTYSFEYAAATHELRHRHARWHLAGAFYTARAPVVDAVLRRSAADLRLLLAPTGIGGGMAPVAALPASGAILGRDALLAAFQTLALDPRVAVDTLRLLAFHQPTVDDAHAGVRGGAIPHVLPVAGTLAPDPARPGGDEAAPEVLETTPLWIALLAETVDWTGDLDLLDELLPAAWRALAWIDGATSRQPQGYLAYPATSVDAAGPTQDGAAPATIAPVVAQAYTYLARRSLARVLRQRGAGDYRAEAAALDLAAERLRRRVERDFWLPAEGCYAPALDDGQPVPATTSAAAHVLWARLPSEARSARLAERLLQSDLASGWGLRTRSSADPAYDPNNARNGCVSSLDTALAAVGLWHAGQREAAFRLARRLFAAAAANVDERLPQFFPGNQGAARALLTSSARVTVDGPAAVAAASPFGVLAALVGARPDALAHRLVLRPALPPWLMGLSMQHLRVGSARVDLEIQRTAEGGPCVVRSRVTSGELRVVVRPPARIQV
jgi:glycogen debranching enzyme